MAVLTLVSTVIVLPKPSLSTDASKYPWPRHQPQFDREGYWCTQFLGCFKTNKNNSQGIITNLTLAPHSWKEDTLTTLKILSSGTLSALFCPVPEHNTDIHTRSKPGATKKCFHLPLPIHRLVEQKWGLLVLLKNPEPTCFLKCDAPAFVVQEDMLFVNEFLCTRVKLEDGYCGNTFQKQQPTITTI